MKSIITTVTVSLLVMDWWDRTYNHAVYARALEGMIAGIKHGIGM